MARRVDTGGMRKDDLLTPFAGSASSSPTHSFIRVGTREQDRAATEEIGSFYVATS